MVEGARLESVYTPKAYRGFESLPLCESKEIFTFILGMEIVVKSISNYSLSVFDFYLLIAIFLYL